MPKQVYILNNRPIKVLTQWDKDMIDLHLSEIAKILESTDWHLAVNTYGDSTTCNYIMSIQSDIRPE